MPFENYVNYAGSKTNRNKFRNLILFENYVNYAGSKTVRTLMISSTLFENYVNYAGSKTRNRYCRYYTRLRTM